VGDIGGSVEGTGRSGWEILRDSGEILEKSGDPE
jgi:hypothetical protein